MAIDLLATNLRIPPETRQHLSRRTLVDALERDIARCKLVVVAAPAGYGTTTLLAQWARRSRFAVAWLSLSEDHNDPERFFRHLVAAWEAVHPRIRESRVAMLTGALSPDMDAVPSAFINACGEIPDESVFVIDDAHLLTERDVLQHLSFLLDYLPSGLHVVLAGRSAPSLPLGRYRARGELAEYRAEDLQFGKEETREFLNDLLELHVSEDEISDLHSRLEGWIAGIQLVSLSLRRSRKAPRPIVVTGRHRFISDYLHEDVLAWLPEEARQFLLQTSILDRLISPLCDAVTGREGSQAMLETLERGNVFIHPLDDNREWYRYHRLFADVLQEELKRLLPDEVAKLHRRAARWHLEMSLPDAAFRHALAAGDDEMGSEICDRYMNELLNTGQLRMLGRWLAEIPDSWRDKHAIIGLADAGLLLMTGAYEAAISRIDAIERQLRSSPSGGPPWQLARVSAIRCFIACFQNDVEGAESFADQALQDLLPDDDTFRADIHHALGDTYRRNGRWDDARAAYLRVFDVPLGRGSSYHAAHVYGGLADLELLRGRLQAAFSYWSRALSAIRKPESRGLFPLPLIGWVDVRLGEILYERNDLVVAREYLERGMQSSGLGGEVRATIAGAVSMARLHLTEGDAAAALSVLEQAGSMVESAAFPDWVARFERCQVEIWLVQGKLRYAVHWAEKMLVDPRKPEVIDRELAHLAVARVFVAKGDRDALGRASALLEGVLQSAEADGRGAVQIEGLALRALLDQGRGHEAAAMTSLEHALRLAEPEGYCRLFVDLGLPMARLLQGARARHVMPGYVDALLAAFGTTAPADITGPRALPGPLSPRERDVLQLVAAGLTNEEIAGKLFISPGTVKKHTGSIYGKLGVGNRTEAAARARELDVLDEQ